MAAHVRPHANVPLGLATTLVFFASRSFSTATDAFVLALDGGSNTKVGIMEGASGVASLVFTVIAGAAADRYGRSRLLKIASVFQALTSCVTLITVLYLQSHDASPSVLFLGLCGASVLRGVCSGFFSAPFEALFGDSTGGARARYYALKGSCYTAGLAAGPAVAVIIFLSLSDTWTLPELSAVLVAGALLGLLLAAMLLGFRDYVPPTEEPAAERAAPLLLGSVQANSQEEGRQQPSPLPPPQRLPHQPEPPAPAEGQEGHPHDPRDALTARVAPLISVSSLLQGLGSGMTYKFVPMFCWKSLGLHPVATHGIVAAFQLTATLGNLVITRLARRLGSPIGAVVLFMLGGCASLAAVCFVNGPTSLVVAALLARGALMNSIGGVLGATLNDHVPQETRARWNVATQLRTVTWSGSAFAGGALADRLGYRKTFMFTLGFHTAAALVLLPLVRLPPEPRAKVAAR